MMVFVVVLKWRFATVFGCAFYPEILMYYTFFFSTVLYFLSLFCDILLHHLIHLF